MTVQVTTVLGPVPVDQLGRVDAHAHLFLRSPILPGEEFQDGDAMTGEVAEVARSGIETVVDLTPIGLGRRPARTARLSRDTGVQVVLATGVHRAAHYPAGHWLYEVDDDTLLDCLVTDLTTGIDERDWQGPRPLPSEVRAGIVKLGASYHHLQPAERRWFRVGAAAGTRCGVPVAVHTEIGTSAHEVLDELEQLGVAPSAVMLAHLDRNPDPGLHVELAARGAFLGYDTIGRTKYHPDAVVLDLIGAVAAAGHAGQILLGTDVGRRGMLRAYGGGPGMAVLGRTFVPRLRAAYGDALVATVLQENPQRLFTGSGAAQP
ncbi:aryldialkylphosphatase [Nocardioides marmoriginsengisoli]|uniref:Aryldialkylphosphatase n=1 Tax=Nocardioides marmoriginsengisoli TaxID=661483 RepID=A0A3N0CFB8_9ACTN|nr:aryldialkylphosphatase [Nocardioides marmoriginsengisoli]RNL62152.1 aryldialkylphosphatase [Nocardioides marmoriginsengisoli]